MVGPSWWSWELEWTAHALRRMAERGVSEWQVRSLLDRPTELERAEGEGRWVVLSRLDHSDWAVVFELDVPARRLVVITVFRIN